MKYFILSLILLCCSVFVKGQNQYSAEPSPVLLKERWEAEWITCPESSLYDYGVYHFRKTLTLDSQLDSFIINISADNRYRLFVNGKPVCWGPARGDIYHWYFDTVDIASLLRPGKNVLAVLVWNFGSYTPGAQMTLKTGLIVQGNSSLEVQANTDKSWKVYHDPAYSPSIEYLQDVGCSDILNASLYPWGWENLDYNDTDWIEVRTIGRGQPYGIGSGYDWILCKRDIPFMEESLLRMNRIRRAEGIDLPSDFLKGKAELKVPANQKVSLFIDQDFLTTAYPELIVSGGKNSLVKFTYSEAMFKDGEKANRNEIEGRDVIGFVDKFYPDGGSNRLFRPLWFRTYRYIKLDIETKDEPLVLHDLYGMYTGYPFKENASFDCDLDFMKQIWETGWRTARLCAHETYFDCPYYEQLQCGRYTYSSSYFSLRRWG